MTAKGELAETSRELLERCADQLPLLVLDILEKLAQERHVQAKNLAGVKELAELFQVGRTTVSNWANPDRGLHFPEPVKELGGGPVYDAIEVIRWWNAWEPWKGRKSGTPPLWLLETSV